MSDENSEIDLDQLHPAIRALKSVCRCNNVKYKTIERAILAGARTINEIAARTSATTGYCGGTCTPEVQKMIEKIGGPAKQETPADPDAWWVRKK